MKPARIAFAVVLIGLGVIGLVDRDYQPLWELPDFVPPALAYVCDAVSIGCGIGLVVRPLPTARVLLAYLVLWTLVCHVKDAVTAPGDLGAWYGVAEPAVIVAAALVLAGFGVRVARVIYGLALIPFGLGHFAYLDRTESLVPSFLPAHHALACATGAAFLAAALAMITGIQARLAAALSAIMIGSFTVLVWLPVIAAGGMNAFTWIELGDTIALAAAGWLVAESYRGA